jgi:prepilin-type N-terminal cleavage/methylation domain-containing protein
LSRCTVFLQMSSNCTVAPNSRIVLCRREREGKTMSPIRNGSKAGFTLIEVTLAVVIIGILIAIIVPRAQRANVDAKYAGVRQAAAEIGRWGNDWATRNLEAQNTAAICNLNDYIATLEGYVDGVNTGGPNWVNVNDDLIGTCRNDPNDGIRYSVGNLIPPDSQPRNPFNGLSYFNVSGGNNRSLQPGLLYLGASEEQTGGVVVRHYYLVYTGTDTSVLDQWHAGMGSGTNPGLPALRNGIFMARQTAR